MEKFKKPRLLTPRGQSHKKFWQAAGLCALTAAIFFLPFYILDGGFFHYAGDFNSQQISFYRYMNGFVKGAGYPDSAFAGAPRNTFSWATDLGSGVMNAYSFYLYGSPFFWLSVLLPQSWLPYMMVPLLVLKFGVAGGGAYLYLRRYVKNANYAVLGACLYALSGFAVYNVFFNHFVDVVALFPYLLWALDEAIYEDRHGLFAFWVAVNLLNNYFFFVGQVLFLCIYFVCKLSARDFRLTGRKFGHLLWESVLGVAMGCLLLFPAVLSLLQNPRTIDLRVDQMMEQNLLNEAKRVWEHRDTYKTAAQAIGYKEFFPYFAGESALAPCVEKLKQASRNYAKRQLTWFRHMEGICWLDASAPDVREQAACLTNEFLAKG